MGKTRSEGWHLTCLFSNWTGGGPDYWCRTQGDGRRTVLESLDHNQAHTKPGMFLPINVAQSCPHCCHTYHSIQFGLWQHGYGLMTLKLGIIPDGASIHLLFVFKQIWANGCFWPSWRFRYWNSLFGNELPITATLGGCILTTQSDMKDNHHSGTMLFVCSLWRVSTLHNGVNGMAGHTKPLAQADSWRLYRDLCELPANGLLLYRQGKCAFVTLSMDAKQHWNIMCINPIWVFAPNHL